MCRFNTEGPVRPDMHYCIPPLARLDDVDRVLGLVRDPPAKTAASAPLFAHPVRPLRDRTLTTDAATGMPIGASRARANAGSATWCA